MEPRRPLASVPEPAARLSVRRVRLVSLGWVGRWRATQPALRARRATASCRSQSACSRIQNCGDIFNSRATQRRVCCDTALAQDDLVETVQRDFEPAGCLDLSDVERLQELLEQPDLLLTL